MRQVNIRSMSEVLTVAEMAAIGLSKLEVTLGVTHNPETAMRDAIAAVVTANEALRQGNLLLGSRRTAVQVHVGGTRKFLTDARNTLKTYFGNSYSQAWNGTGFVGSLTLPTRMIALPPRLQAMQSYLTNTPAHENAPLFVTAVRAGTLHTDLCAAIGQVNEQLTAVDNLAAARDAAVRALREQIRDLIKELSQLMDPLDARWQTFGLNVPGAVETPDAPENLSAVLISGNAALKWKAAPRAERYRVWMKVNGVDQEMQSVGSATDVDFTIEGLPANATIEIAVSAVNNSGESGKSTVVTVITH